MSILKRRQFLTRMWGAGAGLVALAGAWMLNPLCAVIFLLGCVLETIYCLLLKVSPLRTVTRYDRPLSKTSSGSKTIVWEPSQRHCPSTFGVS